MARPLIEIRNLKKSFRSGLIRKQRNPVLKGISFCIDRGETLALVGESGCGKTTVGKCCLGLIRPDNGAVLYRGKNLWTDHLVDAPSFRRRAQMIYQDVTGALNPRMQVRDLILEPLRIHRSLRKIPPMTFQKLMHMVYLSPDLSHRFPHQLSGGQRQRVGIARAMALNPEFIVADEPTASLDRLIQSELLDLMATLKHQFRISYLFISHNLGAVRRIADKVAVMYLGTLVETGPALSVLGEPLHPYTALLLSSEPSLDPAFLRNKPLIKGEADGHTINPSGCLFLPRCPMALKICSLMPPTLHEISEGHAVACHQAEVLFNHDVPPWRIETLQRMRTLEVMK